MLIVAIAHPDDELLWLGGTLQRLSTPQPVSIVCLTNGDHPVRSAEFRDACRTLGAEGTMHAVKDGGLADLPDVSELFAPLLGGGSDACVLTHSPHGEEHNHLQHIQLYSQLYRLARDKKVPLGFFSDRELAEFAYLRLRESESATLYRIMLKPFAVLAGVAAIVRRHAFTPATLCRRMLAYLCRVRSYARYRFFIRVSIDRDKKQSDLALYPSQLHNLKLYAMYHSPFEFLYLEEQGCAEALWEKM